LRDFSGDWRIYGTVSFGIFALPASFLLVFVPALGANRYTFPSPGVRVGWLVVHIAFLLAAYASLAFSMVASFLYLVQERRLKSRFLVMASAVAPPFPQSQRPGGAPGIVGGFLTGFFAAAGYS
jgi:ABC-type uncharacterized transport system permease subunit